MRKVKLIVHETDAYGNGNTVTSSTHIANLNPLRYRGYYYDTETGLYYLQNRYYDPTTGRFLNADSEISPGDILGMNLFAYCGNNPKNRIDPMGNAWLHWIVGAVVVVACAFAVVATAGSASIAIGAVASAAAGSCAFSGSVAVAATAFVASATTYAACVITAAANSSTVEEFAEQGNWGTVIATAGSAVLGGASAYSGKSTSTKKVPNPNGKKGGVAHQNEISKQVSNYKAVGFEVDTEVKIITPGGIKPYRYADFSVTNSSTGQTWYGNVGRQLQSGVPCARERYAISDIQSAGETIKFFPYN